MPNANTKSPCVRNCCLNQEDICLGCFRHLNEITGWNKYSAEQREKIMQLTYLRKLEYKKKLSQSANTKNQNLSE